ncbi:GNAT family N-acetyltransferase [Antarctobacter jejuensis]|uniref:GNAT family N-acetyltransferase n=1 Tax=Antarctobacter jejuensis TaxID=1439938 RepID=UPI003FD2013A
MIIRKAGGADHDAVWAMLEPVFRAGDTYTIDPDIPREAALGYWLGPERRVFVAEDGGEILGTYYIVRNQKGGGSHVCNCGYVTAPAARGRGVARAMLAHSLEQAPRLGFRAMQYNFVVSTNTRAVETWKRAGFEVVGRLPGAFLHPVQGYVDALVMYRRLEDPAAG